MIRAVIQFMEGIMSQFYRFTGKVIFDGKNGTGEKIFYQLNFHNGNLSKRTRQLIGWKDE